MFFFFFKQKTAYEMRISDWSSDVCSSDLPRVIGWIAEDEHRIWQGFGRTFFKRGRAGVDEALEVAERREHVVPLGQKPEIELFVVMDRILLAQSLVGRIRVPVELVFVGIESQRLHRHPIGRASGRERGCQDG